MTSAAIAPEVRAATLEGEVVRVALADGRRAALHTLALRDACACGDCRHPVSGQRLFESGRVLPHVRAEAAHVSEAGELELEWSDGHRGVFPAAWVAAEAAAAALDSRPTRPRRAWGAELRDALPEHSWLDVTASPAARAAWLRDVATLGFSLLHRVPREPGFVETVARAFGAVRETNYGRVFDVSVAVEATNLADTALALSAHTDNPYRDPAPSLQLLHCLEADVEGGDTLLIDGFSAVERLRERNPARLSTLAREPIRFAYRDGESELSADTPIVTLDSRGRVLALHLNNRSKGVPHGEPARVAAWYDAYLALLDLVASPELELVIRLRPGDLIVFDNLRILHGRTGFSGTGRRRLQGCYADRDALLSTLAVLERGDA